MAELELDKLSCSHIISCSVKNKSRTYIIQAEFIAKSSISYSSKKRLEKDWPKSSDTRPLLTPRVISPAGQYTQPVSYLTPKKLIEPLIDSVYIHYSAYLSIAEITTTPSFGVHLPTSLSRHSAFPFVV